MLFSWCCVHAKSIFADPLHMSHACRRFWTCYVYKTLKFFARFWQGGEPLALATQNDASTSKCGANMRCLAHSDFERRFAPQRRALFEHLNFQKCSERGVFCAFLTSKCASRRNGVPFFHISTSKSAPGMVCFVHFDFQMCFAPQRRALFQHLNFEKCSQADVVLCILSATCASRHNGLFFFNISTYLNFQKCSRNGVFCTFSLPNVFRATTACNFAIFHLSSSQMAPRPAL